MTNWTKEEADALVNLLSGNSALKTGLDRFVRSQSRAKMTLCTQFMLSVPRKVEDASDAASKSEVYRLFLGALEADLKSFLGPTQDEGEDDA